MSFKPTDEQKRIFKFITNRPENVIIEALAGCGKTTTIIEAMKLLPEDKSSLFLAFNKHIQQELKDRLPEKTYCFTFHGLGVSAIKRKYGDSIKFDEFKVDHIIKKKAKKWKLEQEHPNHIERMQYLTEMKKLVDMCRQTLTLNKKYVPFIAEKYDIGILDDKGFKRTLSVLEEVMNDKSRYDFIDMVFMPATDPKIWLFQHDYVVVDEIQDLNRAQQKILEKCLKRTKKTGKITGRLIGVGDENQAIYGFTGVSDKSFDWFRNLPNTEILPLTHTFRCGKKIVREANKIVPQLKAFEHADVGVVREGDVLTEPLDGDFVLCRTTTPLIALFFQYLIEGKKAVIKGMDFGLSLIEMIKGHKTIAQLMGHWQNELNKYRTDLRRKGIINPQEHSGYVALEDKIMVLNFIARLSDDINSMISMIKKIFTDELEGIVLSTIHKSKGLEANRVFIARPDKLPLKTKKAWQAKQEKNLEYVAITRAKEELIYDHQWTDEQEE